MSCLFPYKERFIIEQTVFDSQASCRRFIYGTEESQLLRLDRAVEMLTMVLEYEDILRAK